MKPSVALIDAANVADVSPLTVMFPETVGALSVEVPILERSTGASYVIPPRLALALKMELNVALSAKAAWTFSYVESTSINGSGNTV